MTEFIQQERCMIFEGITRDFSLAGQQQYETIGQFWDEMADKYGLENLQGLGYQWQDDKISYAIGLKSGRIEDYNASIVLPDDGWETAAGETSGLKEIYDEIYKNCALQFEIETFYENGTCKIKYYRKSPDL
jgi:predicted transcriptional regulator YdeE